MVRRSALLGALLLLALSSAAFADIAFPTSYSATAVSGGGGGSGTEIGGPGGLTAVGGPVAGFQFFGPADTFTVTYTANFAAGSVGGDLTVHLHGVQVGAGDTATLNSLTWNDTVAVTSTSYSPGLAVLSGDSIKFDRANFGPLLGANQLVLVFTVNTLSGGRTFALDAVSNPEPGTMALFGLGAMGLGGLAWRRRKNAKKASAKA